MGNRLTFSNGVDPDTHGKRDVADRGREVSESYTYCNNCNTAILTTLAHNVIRLRMFPVIESRKGAIARRTARPHNVLAPG